MHPKLYHQITARWPRRKLTRDRFLRLEFCDADIAELEDLVDELQAKIGGDHPTVAHFKGINWPLTVGTLAGVNFLTLQTAADQLQVAHTSLNRRSAEVPHFLTLSDRKLFLMGDIAEARRIFAKAPAVRQQFPRIVTWVKCECCGGRRRVYKDAKPGYTEEES